MAEQQINLATFEFDSDKLEASLNNLRDRMFALKKENEALTTSIKDTKKGVQELTKEQDKLEASGQENSDTYKSNVKILEELNKAEKELFKSQEDVRLSQSRVRTEITATTKQLSAYINSENQVQSLIENGNTALQTQVTNINQARASNTELLRVRNQLNPAIAAEAKLITDLNAKMDSNNKFIKSNASEYEKTKINIGNYTESVKQALKETGLIASATNALPGPFSAVAQSLQQVDEVFKGVSKAYEEFSKGQETVKEAQQGFATATSLATAATESAAIATEQANVVNAQFSIGIATQTEVEAANTAATIANAAATTAQAEATAAATVVTNTSSTALKLFRVALISTGIGAIVVLLGSLVSYLTTTQSGIDALTSVTRPLQAVFQGLMSVLNVLGKSLVDVFSNPKKAILDFGNFIKQNLINRFTAVGEVIKGILNFDFKQVTNGVLQGVTGVQNLTDKIGNASKKTTSFLKEAYERGQLIDKLTKEMEDSQLKYNLAQRKFGDLIDAQLLISKDTSRSFAERAEASREIIRLTEANGKAEEDILKTQLKIFDLKKASQELTKKEVAERTELLNKIEDAGDRGKQAEIEQSKIISGLKKEQHAQELDRIKKIQDAKLAALKTELDFYIASQGEKKKSFAEEISQAEQIKNKQLAINQEEFNQKKINKREFELANLETTNEFLAKQTEATIANAQLEFELFQINQQKKVEANKFYSDEIYNAELLRINSLAEAEAAQQTLLLEKGKINAEEYNLAIAQIDEKQRLANETAAATREQAKKEQQAADIAIQDELNAARFDYDLQLQTERNERLRLQAVEAAKTNGADITAINQLYAKKQIEIERAVTSNKLQLYSQALGNVASLLGESSDAGKAAAIATTTIDTYLGAQKAYTSQLIPGDPSSPIRASLAAGVAVAAGLANVKKIISTKTGSKSTAAPEKPSYASGIIGVGTGTSDSISANLSAGESVLTARATAMFPQEIAAINQAGNGVGLNGLQGSSSLMVQESIRANTESNNNAQEIANAVYLAAKLGTAEGSQTGIKDLSTNRQIMQNAKF